MRKGVMQLVISIFICILLSFLAFAHEEAQDSVVSVHEEKDSVLTKEFATKISIALIILSSINAFVCLALSYISKKNKKIKFLAIIIPIIFTSLFLIITTIFINLNSESSGPVHWHADYEIWACGEKVNLIDPEGFSNKVGTNLFHEHNDDRMHIEGVVEDIEEVNIKHFIETIGGEISTSGISLRTNEDLVRYENGELCNGTLQMFVYKTENKVITQEKVEDFLNYIPSPYSDVPPGDCIIIEFEEEKETTEHVCETYKGENHGS
ncbi:MAG: hypothetical protein Q8R18_01485 [bacterium]|nr:hypothetical protein [bacterium]